MNIKIICKVYSSFNDTPIKGQTTLFIKIKKNKELSKLQLDLANNLSNYVKKDYLIKQKALSYLVKKDYRYLSIYYNRIK
jgi:hypothetical protein